MTGNSSVFGARSISNLAKAYGQLLQKTFGAGRVRAWAESLGFTSRITFKHFLAGRKNLNPNIQEKMKRSLDLGAREQTAFDQLAKSPNPQVEVDPTQTRYVSEDFFQTPLNTLILNLCGVKTKMSRTDLQNILHGVFPAEAISESIQKLLDLKLIEIFEKDYYVRCFEGVLTTVPGQRSLASKEYFRICHSFAEKAWHFPLEEREMAAFTFRMRAEDLPKLKDLVRDFRRSVYELGKTAERDSVFQCSVSAFPVYLERKH